MEVQESYSHPIDGNSNVTISLDAASYVNNIQMKLEDDQSIYRYYVEISSDRIHWKRVVDYTDYDCRSHQCLYFEEQLSRYIRFVGTYSSSGPHFCFTDFTTALARDIPQIRNGVVCLSDVVSFPDSGALVVEEHLDRLRCDDFRYYYKHALGKKAVILQLGQPYIISCIIFRLSLEGTYQYVVETSLDRYNWQLVKIERHQNCTSWQTICLRGRPAIYIKISETYSSSDYALRCSDVLCSSYPREIQSRW